MARLFPRRETAPVLWGCFCCEWLHLSATKTEQFWTALTAAHWSRAVAVRSMVLAQSALATDWREVVRLYEGSMAPGALIATLEDLIKEERLSPLVARRIEEHVLHQTGPRGQWKGDTHA
jgi:hypothetical protein